MRIYFSYERQLTSHCSGQHLRLYSRMPLATLGGAGLADLVGIGILVGLLASLPMQILRLVNAYVSLGPGTRFWALEARVPVPPLRMGRTALAYLPFPGQ